MLQRYLPFWLANLIDRMWPVLVTIVAALIPLSRMLPPLYTFRIRSRIFRWYRRLRDVENDIGIRPNGRAAARARGDRASRRARDACRSPTPTSSTALRTHIHMVAEHLIDPVLRDVPRGA